MQVNFKWKKNSLGWADGRMKYFILCKVYIEVPDKGVNPCLVLNTLTCQVLRKAI
jgi:hypothetical protein